MLMVKRAQMKARRSRTKLRTLKNPVIDETVQNPVHRRLTDGLGIISAFDKINTTKMAVWIVNHDLHNAPGRRGHPATTAADLIEDRVNRPLRHLPEGSKSSKGTQDL